MNESADTPAPASPTTVQALQQQLESLRKLMAVALLVVLVIGVSLAGYLWGQKRIIHRQLAESQKLVDDYERVTAPFLSNFVINLQVYARTHPDINPIMDKYSLWQAVTNVPAPAIPPAPPTPAPKASKK